MVKVNAKSKSNSRLTVIQQHKKPKLGLPRGRPRKSAEQCEIEAAAILLEIASFKREYLPKAQVVVEAPVLVENVIVIDDSDDEREKAKQTTQKPTESPLICKESECIFINLCNKNSKIEARAAWRAMIKRTDQVKVTTRAATRLAESVLDYKDCTNKNYAYARARLMTILSGLSHSDESSVGLISDSSKIANVNCTMLRSASGNKASLTTHSLKNSTMQYYQYTCVVDVPFIIINYGNIKIVVFVKENNIYCWDGKMQIRPKSIALKHESLVGRRTTKEAHAIFKNCTNNIVDTAIEFNLKVCVEHIEVNGDFEEVLNFVHIPKN